MGEFLLEQDDVLHPILTESKLIWRMHQPHRFENKGDFDRRVLVKVLDERRRANGCRALPSV